ncbi:MAG: AlpA family phage regulatory protein [Planktomarina sp.]|nr:AlpA family phage regulatory protein [Planktomarina sp.]
MVQQILRRKDVEKRIGLSRSSIYAMMAEGRFPQPIKLGLRAVGWRSDDLQRWLDGMQRSEP